MITISMTGRVITGEEQPSTEYQLHLEIYEKRPDVQAICHAHPLYATGFAVAGLPLDKLVLPEIISSLGIIPISEYGMPGTAEIAQKIRGQIINHDAILMKNHGALTVGKDLEEAFNRMEMVERYAEIMFAAMLIGKPQPLSLSLAKKLPGFDRVKRQIRRTEPTRDNRIK
jgi:L-fuculose-phosphate aldolase